MWRRLASFSWDVCVSFGDCSIVTSPPTLWQRSCWHDWTTVTLCSLVCRTPLSHRWSASSTLLRGWCMVPAEGPLYRRHHGAALATNPRPHTLQAVSARPPGTKWPVTELLQPAIIRQLSLRSADNNALLIPRTSLKFGRLVLLAPQLGTAFQQRFGQPVALQLLRRNAKLFCSLNLLTLYHYKLLVLLFFILYLLDLYLCYNPLLSDWLIDWNVQLLHAYFLTLTTRNGPKIVSLFLASVFSLKFFMANEVSFLPRCMQCRRGLAMRILSVCLSVRLSVCLSVTRVIPDKMEERSVQIYIPYERTFIPLFWEEE